MSKDLKVLADNREDILLAELAAWLHDAGKLHLGHQAKYLRDKKKTNYNHTKFGPGRAKQFLQNFAGSFPQIQIMREQTSLQEIIRDHHKRYFGNCHVANNVVCLIQRADWLDSEYDRSGIITRGTQAPLVQPTSLGFGIFSVFGLAVHLYKLDENSETIRKKAASCSYNDKLTTLLCSLKRYLTRSNVSGFNQRQRKDFISIIKITLNKAAGDTRYSVNDIALWEHSWSVSILAKSFVAWSVLNDLSWGSKIKDGSSLSNLVKEHKKFTSWFRPQLLPLRIDGLAYLAQSNNIPDLLARRELLTRIYDTFKDILEWEFPLAGEVYRDENGPVFLTFLRDENGQNPIPLSALQLPDDSNDTHVLREAYLRALQASKQSLEDYLRQAVVELSQGDLTLPPEIPLFTYTQKSTKAVGEKSLGDLLADEQKQGLWLQADAKTIQDAWKDTEEICSVCGLRPQGYGAKDNNKRKKAISRKMCGVCLERRVDRAKTWIQGIHKPSRERFRNNHPETVWLGEVADANGRLALIVGYFPLEHWLDGTLVESLAMFKRSSAASGATNRKVQVTDENDKTHEVVLGPKPVSYSRLRRIWKTTRRFWQDVVSTDTPPQKLQDFCKSNGLNLEDLWEKPLSPDESLAGKVIGQAGPRLEIRDIPNRMQNRLGNYHAYELRFPQGMKMAVVWDSNNRRLITAENLIYIARLLGWEIPAKEENESEHDYRARLHQKAVSFVQEKLTNSKVTLEESSHYGGRTQVLGTFSITGSNVSIIANSTYTPLIPILAEPRTFMALVPANKALDVVRAIKTKYEREMGKVRNRLPLHIGVVFAPRMMPLRAILDAGRKMLKQKSNPIIWRVKCVARKQIEKGDDLPERFHPDRDKQFKEWYEITLENEKQITWFVPALMGDGKTKDEWYPYAFLASPDKPENREKYYEAKNPWVESGKHKWLVHTEELRIDDKIYFTPATFDFIFLESNIRRHDVAYEDGRRITDSRKPYLLDEIEEIKETWEILSQNLKSAQIHQMVELIESTRERWFGYHTQDIWEKSKKDKAFKAFCRSIIVNAEWKTKPPEKIIEKLTNHAVSGLLTDAFTLYHRIMKEKAKND